ncbi:RICIN domain-containing protein [Streptomyces sp. NPDC026206]|uniref:RICIN domain-containing protein n=1 Tax=Streptomyces sp. NPDC026206 TaxID=3157089 RepID=UPI003405F1E1
MARIIRAALAIGASLVALAGGATTAYADGRDPAEAAARAAAAAAEAAAKARAAALEAHNRTGLPETVVQLQAAHSGKCLDIDHAKTENGVRARQWTCNGSDAQKWRMVPAADSSYELRSVPSGKCLEVENSDTKAGAAVQQWSCVNTKQMRWQVVLVDPVKKLHQLRPMHTEDRCLDIVDAKTDNGAKAQQWSCNQTDAQLWQIQPVK